MCLAKWTQVTIQLQTGHTHSCHHPKTHKIPLKELDRTPSALHNTKFKKQRRKEMLNGVRPEECDYCWNVEDNSDRFSDRILKSGASWSHPHFQEIKDMDSNENFNPKYVEAYANIGNILGLIGKHSEAIKVFEDIFTISQKLFSPICDRSTITPFSLQVFITSLPNSLRPKLLIFFLLYISS